MEVGAFGWGQLKGITRTDAYLTSNDGVPGGFFAQSGGASDSAFAAYGAGICLPYGFSGNGSVAYSGNIFLAANGVLKTRFSSVPVGTGTSTLPVHTVYSTVNTTKASDGTLKAASPVVKLFHDGRYETNDESEGCAVERICVGEYLITGCIGLNSDAAWGGISGGFDIPKDRNGQPLVWLDFEVNADGSILVKTYHRTYPDAPKFAQNRIGSEDENGVFIETISEGEPIDIPADQFVSVRVEMPADSIWNQKQSTIQAQSPEE